MRDLQVRVLPHPHIPVRCALVSDSWPGKGNMAEGTMRGFQVQRLYSALTFSGVYSTSSVWSLAGSSCSLKKQTHRFADTHYETYAKRCADLGISPHPRAQRKEEGFGEGEMYARLMAV